MNIADIRRDYKLLSFSENEASLNAIDQFTTWFNNAVSSNIDEVNAMVLSTASTVGKPSARVVLLKGYSNEGFTFFTNYNSNKGEAITANNQVALTFFWKELERQIRIEGVAIKLSEEESNTYFNSRPNTSKIGAWSSPQSTVIANRSILEENEQHYTEKFKDEIPKPPFWGGYCVKPMLIEFWQGRSSRLHDRLQYTLQENNTWKIERLAP